MTALIDPINCDVLAFVNGVTGGAGVAASFDAAIASAESGNRVRRPRLPQLAQPAAPICLRF